ncbi:MAG: hypothetical protein J6C13_04980 [Clostridia bacterium]|nr:hypothetical protein [Clostridia bacterium]
MKNKNINLSTEFARPLGGGALNRLIFYVFLHVKNPQKMTRFCTLKGGTKC